MIIKYEGLSDMNHFSQQHGTFKFATVTYFVF